MTDRQIAGYIYEFMERLNIVECIIGIPEQAIERFPMFKNTLLNADMETISVFIKYFGQCKHLMQKHPEKYYVWLQSPHEHGGEQANYVQIERKYCQMIYLVKMVFQEAGLQHEFKKAVAKANEEWKLWKQTLKDND